MAVNENQSLSVLKQTSFDENRPSLTQWWPERLRLGLWTTLGAYGDFGTTSWGTVSRWVYPQDSEHEPNTNPYVKAQEGEEEVGRIKRKQKQQQQKQNKNHPKNNNSMLIGARRERVRRVHVGQAWAAMAWTCTTRRGSIASFASPPPTPPPPSNLLPPPPTHTHTHTHTSPPLLHALTTCCRYVTVFSGYGRAIMLWESGPKQRL